MIDMTNNRVMYSLLTDDEKAALHEHEKTGGRFLVCIDGDQAWGSISSPSWADEAVYRTVPLPLTQDEIAWEKLPKRFHWVAREENEEVWAYERQPYELGWWSFDEGDAIRIDDFPGIVLKIGTVDWKDSKQRRPRG